MGQGADRNSEEMKIGGEEGVDAKGKEDDERREPHVEEEGILFLQTALQFVVQSPYMESLPRSFSLLSCYGIGSGGYNAPIIQFFSRPSQLTRESLCRPLDLSFALMRSLGCNKCYRDQCVLSGVIVLCMMS